MWKVGDCRRESGGGVGHLGMKDLGEHRQVNCPHVVALVRSFDEADLFPTTDTIEGLHKIGFRTNKGYKEAGLLLTRVYQQRHTPQIGTATH